MAAPTIPSVGGAGGNNNRVGQARSHIEAGVIGSSIDAFVAVAASTTSGQLVSIKNNAQDKLISRVLVHMRGGPTLDATVDVGVGAATGTDATNLIDGLVLKAGAPETLYDNIDNHGTAGKAKAIWKQGQWLNVTVNTGDANQLVADFHVDYRLAAVGGSGGPFGR